MLLQSDNNRECGNGVRTDILINELKRRIQVNSYMYGQLIFDNRPRQFNEGIYSLLQKVRTTIYTRKTKRKNEKGKRQQKRETFGSLSHTICKN